MPSYKVEFFDKLLVNLRKIEGQLTATEDSNLTKTVKNTCLFARALYDTFKDVDDVVGIIRMSAACDFSPIDKE